MKTKYLTFLLIAILSVSTPAFAQTLVIFKDATSIEVDSVSYENNQCIYTKNGSQKTVPLSLVEEIYVLNQGVLYPPEHIEPKHREPKYREPKHREQTETPDPEISSLRKEKYERKREKKKSENTTASKDTVASAEQTYLYKSPEGFFQCEIPKSWNHSEMGGMYMFSPYPLKSKDVSKIMVQIHRVQGIPGPTSISKEHRAIMMKQFEKMGEKLLQERDRVIDGIETWEKYLETTQLGPGLKHEIMFMHRGALVAVSLDASPELFQAADAQFEKILASLKFF